MEASVRAPRRIDGDKAQRIIAAMRSSVAERGAAAATFDHVAQEAGVSRGLLHYYFGSKERLLVEVLRHDCAERMGALEGDLAATRSIEEILDVLVASLEGFLAEDADTGAYAFVFEMFTVSRHNAEIRRAMAELYGAIRGHVAEVLERKHREGVVDLRAEPEAVAGLLLALCDGIALQVISDPEWDSSAAFAAGEAMARHLLGG